MSCTPHWTTATGSVSSTVLTTLKMSGWMSSSASKMVTTSLWVWRKPTFRPCGLLMGLFLKTITCTLVAPVRRTSPGPPRVRREVPGGRQGDAQQIRCQVVDTQVTHQDPQGARRDNQASQRHQVEPGEASQGELCALEGPAVIPVKVVDDAQLGRQGRGDHEG